MTCRIRPLEDRLVVKRVQAKKYADEGKLIQIPETSQDRPQEGIVLAVGEGSRNSTGDLVPLAVSVGDKVLFGKYLGTEIEIDGEVVIIMKYSECLAVLMPAEGLTSRAANRHPVG